MVGQADPVTIPEISAELGKWKTTKLEVENPLGDDVVFRVHNSNPTNFKLKMENPHEPGPPTCPRKGGADAF